MSEIVHEPEKGTIDTRSFVDRVYENILDRIITGSIKYGDTISIKKVAAELRVSSMPVREAMKRLEFEGVVSIKPRSACKVRVPTRKRILEVYELREALEAYAVTSSAVKASPAALAHMQQIVEQMRLLAEEGDADLREKKAIELDRQFHAEIIALAGNELLNAFSRQLSLHVNMTLMHEKTYNSLEGRWAEMHAEILACIPADPSRAVQMLRAHFASATALWKLDGAGNPLAARPS